MSYALSRTMSAATATYAGFCFVRPEHLGQAMGADRHEQPGYDLLAEVFGVRDLAVSTFGLLGRSDRTVRTAMWIRIACDIGDGIAFAARTDDDATRTKALAATLTWATLNITALHVDKLRARKKALTEKAADAVTSTARSVAGAVVDKVTP